MSKLLLWVCVGIGGGIGALIPSLFGSSSILLPAILSTVGGLVGIWFWYRYLRFS